MSMATGAATIIMRVELATAVPRIVLALGAEQKNTVCCAAGRVADISEPVADVGDADGFESMMRMVVDLPRSRGVEPMCIAHDLHPEYASTKLARRCDLWPGVPRCAVQHHEAHVASCAASEGVWDDCVGLAFDGTGFGTDDTMWGGEFFFGSVAKGFARVGRLRPMALLGGAAAIREPWRLALALATDAGEPWPKPAGVRDEAWHVVHAMMKEHGGAALRSSSAGRLFDGVAALAGLCVNAEREAQAAIALEQAAGGRGTTARYAIPSVRTADGLWELDWRPMVRSIITEERRGAGAAEIAAKFHDSFADAVAEVCAKVAGTIRTVVASGGVFWNKRLTTTLRTRIEERQCRLVTPTRVPPSDAGVSLGQAMLAAWVGERDAG